MIWLLTNIRLVGIAAGVVAIFFGGYHLRTLQYEAAQTKTLVKTVEKLGESQNGIIRFNQALDKGIRASKDACLNNPIPPSIKLLLGSK